MTGTERARLIRHLADRLAENAEALAAIETMDNGKLLREMRGQLTSLPEWYSYFAGAADKIQGETIPSDKPNFFVYTRREPWPLAIRDLAFDPDAQVARTQFFHERGRFGD